MTGWNVDRWLGSLNRVSDSTRDVYARDIRAAVEWFERAGHRAPEDVTRRSLHRYLAHLDVRRYARRIRAMVESRDMPPYQYDTDTGIQELKYDPRMSEEDIDKISAWVDAGTPEGDPADMPPPVEWPDPAEWRLADRFGQPDVIVRSDPYDVPANGQDRWWRPLVPTGIEEERCIMAIETKPSVAGRAVTHHANSSFRVDGGQGGRLSEYALGKLGDKGVTELLQNMMVEGDQTLAKMSAIASALGYIGDYRTIRPLNDMLFDGNLPDLTRAFAAVALGGVADKEPLPWNSKIGVDINYRAATETLTSGSTGVLDIRALNLPVNSEAVVEFDITLASALTNGTVVSNQSTLFRSDGSTITLSDSPPSVIRRKPRSISCSPSRCVTSAPTSTRRDAISSSAVRMSAGGPE